ncbi:hypothetical protein M5D96_006230, partial [Drosophila gunungcola]
ALIPLIVLQSWLWHPGWPLATSNGALVLQLSDAEIAHALRPAELYLCIKLESSAESDADCTPRLYAVWRSSRTEESVQSHCIDHENPGQLPLSVLQLEMSTAAAALMAADGGELPQLLQNLLVSVERSIERVSLNELQMPMHHGPGEDLLDEANNNGCNNLVGSPRCALRRSDLITKNKLFNSRYMLRRLTNRQDSMNSTSSGNSNVSDRSSSSSSSSNSSAGEELLTSSVEAKKRSLIGGGNEASGASTSPALPLFCLGNSFPHIDSDEEPSDTVGPGKHHSLETCETELLPPSSIGELPEKLLTSGVYLPGTRTLQGDPLVSVDAACVASAGLNCYELATLLLYYSTIPERSGSSCAEKWHICCSRLIIIISISISISTHPIPPHSILSHPIPSSPVFIDLTHDDSCSLYTPTTPGTTATINGHKSAEQLQQQQQQQQQQLKQQPAQQTFTILIAIEKSQHLCVIDLICQSLRLLAKQIGNCEILAVCPDSSLLQLCNEQQQQKQQQQNNNSDHPSRQVLRHRSCPLDCCPPCPPCPRWPGLSQRHHDAAKWREFFAQLEAFQRQCSTAGGRLVSALSEIRAADLQGLPTRRQLYGQHRALSRALMDSQLHSLRKMGAGQLARLQDLARAITSAPVSPRMTSQPQSPSSGAFLNVDAACKLRKVTLLFNEVDRAAQRLEQLTEQRRERLRQLTRQRALEDEISESRDADADAYAAADDDVDDDDDATRSICRFLAF